MAITAQDVMKLRKMTSAGMMDCKNALNEANGNFEEAIKIIGEYISLADGAIMSHPNMSIFKNGKVRTMTHEE